MGYGIEREIANLGIPHIPPDRRRTPRFIFDVRLSVRSSKNQSRAIPARILDLSCDGVKAIIAGDLEVGDALELEFGLPRTSAVVRLKAAVRWREGYQHGLQFIYEAASDREKMKHAFAAVGCHPQ